MIMEEDKGKWEEIIHKKIYDFEVETNTGDWETLASKLPDGKAIQFMPYRKIFLSAAAVAAVIAVIVIGGLNLFSNKDNARNNLVAVDNQLPQITEEVEVYVENPVENSVENTVENLLALVRTQEKITIAADPVAIQEDEPTAINSFQTDESDAIQEQESAIDFQPGIDLDSDYSAMVIPEEIGHETPNIADATPEAKRRRWGFGVGTGSVSTGATSSNTGVMASSRFLKPDEYMHDGILSLRSSPQTATAALIDPIDGIEFPKDDAAGKVKHKIPISGGLGVSYYLTDRLSIQSGAVYTLLRSSGSNYEDGNQSDWKQNLHFVGVPLSVSYSIAEWKRINFYISAGGMGEWNVAGKIKRTAIVENLEIVGNEKLSMNNPMWSVNTRAGAVYPLWKFVNLYAEAGAAYYFDNKSGIETIRSNKPFNVSLQAGIRLGF